MTAVSSLSSPLLELRSSLSSFVETNSIRDYDREAELALSRLSSGDTDINGLTNAWAKAYAEVGTVAYRNPPLPLHGAAGSVTVGAAV